MSNHPYKTLGTHLRYLREQQSESLAEVSGAVEIDDTVLERIEAGAERPSEDILMLLISHFNMQDQEAVQLWEMAGYDGSSDRQKHQEDMLHDALASQKAVIFVVGMDGRTLYSDTAKVSADGAGVVMDFGKLNSKKQAQPLAKLGMSYEQAFRVMQQLQTALLQAKHNSKPKQLPPPSNT